MTQIMICKADFPDKQLGDRDQDRTISNEHGDGDLKIAIAMLSTVIPPRAEGMIVQLFCVLFMSLVATSVESLGGTRELETRQTVSSENKAVQLIGVVTLHIDRIREQGGLAQVEWPNTINALLGIEGERRDAEKVRDDFLEMLTGIESMQFAMVAVDERLDVWIEITTADNVPIETLEEQLNEFKASRDDASLLSNWLKSQRIEVAKDKGVLLLQKVETNILPTEELFDEFRSTRRYERAREGLRRALSARGDTVADWFVDIESIVAASQETGSETMLDNLTFLSGAMTVDDRRIGIDFYLPVTEPRSGLLGLFAFGRLHSKVPTWVPDKTVTLSSLELDLGSAVEAFESMEPRSLEHIPYFQEINDYRDLVSWWSDDILHQAVEKCAGRIIVLRIATDDPMLNWQAPVYAIEFKEAADARRALREYLRLAEDGSTANIKIKVVDEAVQYWSHDGRHFPKFAMNPHRRRFGYAFPNSVGMPAWNANFSICVVEEFLIVSNAFEPVEAILDSYKRRAAGQAPLVVRLHDDVLKQEQDNAPSYLCAIDCEMLAWAIRQVASEPLLRSWADAELRRGVENSIGHKILPLENLRDELTTIATRAEPSISTKLYSRRNELRLSIDIQFQ